MIRRQKRVRSARELTANYGFIRRQRMGDHRHQTMFGDVFRTHVTHQRPAVNQLHHAGDGRKMKPASPGITFTFSLRQAIVREG